jgi:hypothetical protein
LRFFGRGERKDLGGDLWREGLLLAVTPSLCPKALKAERAE